VNSVAVGGARKVDREGDGGAYDGGKEGGGSYEGREGEAVTTVGGEGW